MAVSPPKRPASKAKKMSWEAIHAMRRDKHARK